MKAKEYITKAIDEYYVLREHMINRVKNNIGAACKDFFAENPEVRFITWAQYTDYFNDGDTCEFYMREVEFSLDDRINMNDIYAYNLGYALEDAEEKDLKYYSPEYAPYGAEPIKAYDEFAEFLKSLEEPFEEIFGDHMRVFITPDGITTEEYIDHD